MACRDAFNVRSVQLDIETISDDVGTQQPDSLLFGVESKYQANDILQNNLTLFEWVERNKLTPNFWGRNIVGDNKLTLSEIRYLHLNGCSIVPIYSVSSEKLYEQQGIDAANEIHSIVADLGIPEGTAVFLEINEEYVTVEYMYGFAAKLLENGYIPAFKANTDAKYSFDREFSRGMRSNKEIFQKCIIWAVSPTIPEYDEMTTSHFIHPDVWSPYAPSGITRKDIVVWQYGKNCHPIYDDANCKVTFNLQLVSNMNTIVDKFY